MTTDDELQHWIATKIPNYFLNYKEILDNSWKRKGLGIIMISWDNDLY